MGIAGVTVTITREASCPQLRSLAGIQAGEGRYAHDTFTPDAKSVTANMNNSPANFTSKAEHERDAFYSLVYNGAGRNLKIRQFLVQTLS